MLKTFLHDPLVEWSKPVKGSSKTQANESGEIVNEKVFKTHCVVCVCCVCVTECPFLKKKKDTKIRKHERGKRFLLISTERRTPVCRVVTFTH